MTSKSIEIVRSIVVGTGTVEIGVSEEGEIFGEDVARPRTHNRPDKDAHHFYVWNSLHGALIQYPNNGCASRLCPAGRYAQRSRLNLFDQIVHDKP